MECAFHPAKANKSKAKHRTSQWGAVKHLSGAAERIDPNLLICFPHYPSTTLKAMPFSDEEMIAASELREFVYCEKAWSLARQGFAVSPEAQAQRKAGIVFHEERATSAVNSHNPRTAVWILVLVATAIILLAIYTLRIGGR
jgi:hypothetical protein